MVALALVHLGRTVPSYIYDCIYQCLVLNGFSCKIFVILDKEVINDFNAVVRKLDVNRYFKTNCLYNAETFVTAIPVSTLDEYLKSCSHWEDYTETMSTRFKENSNFRDGFWISTTARFFYIEALMELLKLDNVFHIENDIVMYETFREIYNTMITVKKFSTSKIWLVQDSPMRVVPSILYFPSVTNVNHLNKHIADHVLRSNTFVNDMEILGAYPESSKELLNVFPDEERQHRLMFDGAAIGQYIGGIDTRNIQGGSSKDYQSKIDYTNPSIGFVNETSIFKPDTCMFSRMSVSTDIHNIPLKILVCKPNKRNDRGVINVANIHMHSKQLYRFSSVFDIDYKDIITGDRVVELCDFVIGTHEIFRFHEGLANFAKDPISIKDWKNVNMHKLNGFFKDFSVKNKTSEIKIFVYTHILQNFQTYILKHLDASLKFVLYLHNSDHPFDLTYKEIINDQRIKHVYAQNIDYPKDCDSKLSLLPIGIANSMWKHGDLVSLYTTMKEFYKYKKTKSIYININASTYSYRKNVLDAIQRINSWPLSSSKPYIEYLKELAQHRFCLCMRGNGLDTHRFWECLYLGVVPVIIANKHTNLDNFAFYLSKLNVPYIILKDDDLDSMCQKYTSDYFNNNRYIKVINDTGVNLYCNPSLKITNYLM